MSLKDTLRGTGVALVTPFNDNGSVDFTALAALLEYVVHGGVEYVVALGTTGETPTLDKSEKIDIVNFVYETIAGRIPVVVGVGGNNTAEVVKNLEQFPLARAEAVLSTCPYYNKPSQEGIFQHYRAVAGNSPRPVLLYNVPGRTGVNITAPTALRLAHEVANVGGIKEASGNMIQCMHILKDRPAEFMVCSGDDHITMPLIACGMDGVISVAANSFPKDYAEMVRLSLAHNFAAAGGLHYKMLHGIDLMFAENNPAGVKAILSEMGIIKNNFRLPLVPLSAHLHQQVRNMLEDYRM